MIKILLLFIILYICNAEYLRDSKCPYYMKNKILQKLNNYKNQNNKIKLNEAIFDISKKK